MPGFVFRTPVALFIFKRPATTRRVFAAIAAARPPRLFLVADGPRNPQEADECAATRAVVARVDWDCEVITDFAAANLGLKRRLASGLAWVFAQAEEAIILEDDCLPHPTFFRFCQEMLARYRDQPQVMHIGGFNPAPGWAAANSYLFSRYPRVWGWASWRRAWAFYDADLRGWTGAADKGVYLARFAHRRERQYWRLVWDGVASGQINTWDYQWAFACLAREGLSVVPGVNLVTNIGFGPAATHTRRDHPLANHPSTAALFPLEHPPAIARHAAYDAHIARTSFMVPALRRRIAGRLWRLVRRRRPG